MSIHHAPDVRAPRLLAPRIFVVATLLATLVGAYAGCDSKAAVGAKGGECRLGRPACDDALVCYEGTCNDASDVPPEPITEEAFTATVELTKTSMKADGQDTVIFAFDLLDRKTGQPTTLPGVLVRTHPINAGRVKPAKLPLEKGHGVVEIKACNTQYSDCPATFRIVLATIEYPTVPILQSPDITYEGILAPQADGGIVGTGGAGGDVGGAGGDVGGAGGGFGAAGATGAGGNLPEQPLTQGDVDNGKFQMSVLLSNCAALNPDDPNVPPDQLTLCDNCLDVMRGGADGVLFYTDDVASTPDAVPVLRTIRLSLSGFSSLEDPLFPHVARFTGGGMTFAYPFGRTGYRDACDRPIEVAGNVAVLSAAAGCDVTALDNCGPKMGGSFKGELEVLGYLTSTPSSQLACPLTYTACINTFGGILPPAP